MVKRKTTRRRSTTPRARTVYRTAPRRRRTNKTGYDKIPGAIATVALVAANKNQIRDGINMVTNSGSAKFSEWPSRAVSIVTSTKGWGKQVRDGFVKNIPADVMAVVGGYVGGEAIKKFAPTMVKKPLAKLAKKVPKVI